MHSVPVFFAVRLQSEEHFTAAAFMFFDFVVKSVFVLLQSTGAFTLILTLDSIFHAVTYIVVDL